MTDPPLLPPPLPEFSSEVSPQIITRRQRWIDLCFVIGVTLSPQIIGSTTVALHPEMLRFTGTGIQVVQQIGMALGGLAILSYVFWKRGTGIDAFGKLPQRMDIVRGVLLFAAAYLAVFISAVAYFQIHRHFTGHDSTEINIAAMYASRFQILTIAFLFINPWYEELIVRGFLMTELSQLTNVTIAVLASTVIQASYHTYQGSTNLVQLVPTFLLFSIYYTRTRRLFPLIVAHTLMDFLPLLWYAFRHKAH